MTVPNSIEELITNLKFRTHKAVVRAKTRYAYVTPNDDPFDPEVATDVLLGTVVSDLEHTYMLISKNAAFSNHIDLIPSRYEKALIRAIAFADGFQEILTNDTSTHAELFTALYAIFTALRSRFHNS